MEEVKVQEINLKIKHALILSLEKFQSTYETDIFSKAQAEEFYEFINDEKEIFYKFYSTKSMYDLVVFSGLSLYYPDSKKFLSRIRSIFSLKNEDFTEEDLAKLHSVVNEYPNLVYNNFGQEFQNEFTPNSN